MTSLRSIILLYALACLAQYSSVYSISMMNKADPYPVFTSNDPNDFLTTDMRNRLKIGYEEIRPHERFTFSISPFGQKADAAQTRQCVPDTTNVPNGQICPPTLIGNVYGPWNMLGVFYPENNGNTEVQEYLLTALNVTGTLICNDASLTGTCLQNITNPEFSDPTKQFGFVNVPVCYRKLGCRFEGEFLIGCGFGLQLQTGVVDIRQTATFTDLTCSATGLACPYTDCQGNSGTCQIAGWSCSCKQVVMDTITSKVYKVARLLNQNAQNYHEVSADDTRLRLFWRRLFPINYGPRETKNDWPHYLIMPYVTLDGIFPTGSTVCASKLFALPSGNNGHWGGGITTGFIIDFEETIEIGFELGGTFFSNKTYCNFPLPTNWLQNGIYPHTGNVTVHPGKNWNAGFKFGAYHFLDRLSIYVQLMAVNHGKDCFRVNSINPINGYTAPISTILTDKLHVQSGFFASFVNTGLNYDISPNMSLGFFWQAPVKRKFAYRSTTLMGTLTLTY